MTSEPSSLDEAATGERGRFAPSTTGSAHPGTLLSALLVWLDARSRGASVDLRLEDLDPNRCKPEYADDLIEATAWLGLTWDRVVVQSHSAQAHRDALRALCEAERLYRCDCSRSTIRRDGRRGVDGGWAYVNRCRDRTLTPEALAAGVGPDSAVRVRLEDGAVRVHDEGGRDLSQLPAIDLGDPVVVRKDGSVAYQLAVVVDDHTSGVTRVVRGRDIETSTATQVALYRLLGWAVPVYRHHPLLLERRGKKLAKMHGSVSWRELAEEHEAEHVLGTLAHAVGLLEEPGAVALSSLVDRFAWDRVQDEDRVVDWVDGDLIVGPRGVVD